MDILETIKAIRSKDPRVYDGQTRFFKPAPGSDEEDEDDEPEKKKKEKPMYLKDYHRENLLNGGVGLEEEEEEVEAPRTYHQQQDALKRDLVMDMHRQAEGLVEKAEAEEDNDDDDFLVTKTKIKRSDKSVGVPPPPAPETADPGDPDSYLTSFLASKAWLPQDRKNIYGPAMESDDSEEEDIAEKFEEGFNLRFEDPTKAAQLVGHARGAIKLMSTRRNEMSARKRARELKKQKKEDERKLREIEKGRLRVLKVEELTKKVKKIREVAGLEGGGGEEDLKDWKKLLDGGFSDEQWDAEMSKKFDDTYYETKEGKMPEKPTWDNDIDVGDIGSDLDVEAGEGEDEEGGDPAITGESSSKPKRKTRKDYEREKREKKQQERKIRKEVEEYVDENFDFEDQVRAPPLVYPSNCSNSY